MFRPDFQNSVVGPTNHGAKFRADRPAKLRDSVAKKKFKKKTSAVKHKTAPRTIVSERTNKNHHS